jgi:hypothetical protein
MPFTKGDAGSPVRVSGHGVQTAISRDDFSSIALQQ